MKPNDFMFCNFLPCVLQPPQVLHLSPKHTSSRSWKALGFHLSFPLKGHGGSFSTRASISCFFSNERKYLERWLVTAMKCPPGASETFLIGAKMLHEYEQHQNNESCAAAKWEFTHVGLLRWWKRDASHTLNLWQDSLKARALAYQFFFLASQRRDDVRCGGAVCFISLQSSTPHLLPSFHFQVWSKGLRKHMQSIASLQRKQVDGFTSVLYVWFFIPSLAFPSPLFSEKHLSRLMYSPNKPVLTKQGGE